MKPLNTDYIKYDLCKALTLLRILKAHVTRMSAMYGLNSAQWKAALRQAKDMFDDMPVPYEIVEDS